MTIFDTLISVTKNIAVYILYFAMIGITIYIVSYLYIRQKRNRELEDVQREVIREGKINVKKLKLRRLYSSYKESNPIDEGKIVAFVPAKNDNNMYSIFCVKKTPLSSFKFFKVRLGEHTDLFRDVTLKNWNFILDETSTFFIDNKKIVTREVDYNDKDKKLFDTLQNLAPLVHKAILANFVHRMKIRERKLIKLPEDELKS